MKSFVIGSAITAFLVGSIEAVIFCPGAFSWTTGVVTDDGCSSWAMKVGDKENIYIGPNTMKNKGYLDGRVCSGVNLGGDCSWLHDLPQVTVGGYTFWNIPGTWSYERTA